MPPQAATWLQVSASRYLLHRMEGALLGADFARSVGPRRVSLAIGCGVTLVALVGCLIASQLWPQPGLGDAGMVMDEASGALFVRVGDTWHPVLNLASARLITGTSVNPRPVPESRLSRTKRGPLLGIPGAPQLLTATLPMTESAWTVCDGDATAGTSVFVGPVSGLPVDRIDAQRAVLVAVGAGAPAYLLYHGQRALVNVADRAIVRSLRLQEHTPRIVSQTLLNALTEGPPIAAPRIRGAGAPAGAWLPGFQVGNVLRITRSAGDEYYVVLDSGVQRISQIIADVLRFSVSQGSADVITVPPDLLRAAPIVNTLPVSKFPDQAPSDIAGAALCVAWTPVESGRPDVVVMAGTGTRFPVPVALTQADGRGPAVDSFSIPSGRSAYVASVSQTGDQRRMDTRYLVTETGVRFAIHDEDAAHALGLPAAPAAAPWPVLSALPCGPELSREKASVARDTVAAQP
ncbi:type VII secretion protein EccB [Mycobacterium sp. ML4]